MMPLREALEPIAANRGDRVVITTMSSVGVWPQLSDSARDFHYLPSSMGQGVSLGLGLCLSRFGLGAIVLTGDGSLLMNLGCLVTVAQYRVPLAIVLLDNGLYEVTGGQEVPGRGEPISRHWPAAPASTESSPSKAWTNGARIPLPVSAATSRRSSGSR